MQHECERLLRMRVCFIKIQCMLTLRYLRFKQFYQANIQFYFNIPTERVLGIKMSSRSTRIDLSVVK